MSIPIITDPEVVAEIDAAEAKYVAALERQAVDREEGREQVRVQAQKRNAAALERRREAAEERRLRGPGW